MSDEELAKYLHLTTAEAAIVIPKLTPQRRAVYDRMASLETDIFLFTTPTFLAAGCHFRHHRPPLLLWRRSADG